MVLLIISGLAALGSAQMGQEQRTETPEPLGEGLGWMTIPDVEHTSDYLSKTGGSGGDPQAYTSAKVAGNWSLELVDLRSRPVARIYMELFQVGTVVFGRGTAGNEMATANGAIIGNTALNMGVVTLPSANLFNVKLTLSGDSASGNFDGFTASGQYFQGTATATKDVPLALS
ncbi:MAG: hypothetical protein GKC10_03385 [Methanosarcinales archaeon]|nr:hypothetical protein [Methanosarcinales archaeon]